MVSSPDPASKVEVQVAGELLPLVGALAGHAGAADSPFACRLRFPADGAVLPVKAEDLDLGSSGQDGLRPVRVVARQPLAVPSGHLRTPQEDGSGSKSEESQRIH